MTGSLLGGYITGQFEPEYAFLATSVLAAITFFVGLLLPRAVEYVPEHIAKMSIWELTKQNAKEIYRAMRLKELHRSILFFVIQGLIVPSFADYLYYYETDPQYNADFTQF